MIPIRKLNGLNAEERERLFKRFGEDFLSIMIDRVIPIVTDVQKRGDAAVKEYTERFDGICLESVMADTAEIDEGAGRVPEDIVAAFSAAKENIEEFHRHQLREDISYTREDGTLLGLMYQPIERAAVYVPGGKARYPSSVLMGVIPAQIAGTAAITLITPPDEKGRVPDSIAAACKLCGITSVIKAGGAQGIAAAGFGTESVSASDIIVGPGNVYVTAAKTYLFSTGTIQIDSLAGPSEVLIIADEKANPKWVAWDLLSQAEHEEMATAILVTPSEKLAEKVREEIEADIASGRGRHDIKKKAIQEHGLILLVDSVEEAIEFSNRYAPEHMEFMVEAPRSYLPKIKNVGSLFLGYHTPVAVGDYYSGTNHILPTGGAARFSSGTAVDTFLRRTTYQELTPGALRKARGPVKLMSGAEGFDDKHGGSVDVRFDVSV